MEYKNELKNNNSKKEQMEVEDIDIINKRLADKAMNKNNFLEENKKTKNEEFEEPIPRGNNKFCNICNFKIDNYLKHIKSYDHLENIRRYNNIFNRVKKTFGNIIDFWDKKNKANSEINNNKNTESDLLNNNDMIGNENLFLNKSEDVSTKERSCQDNIAHNIVANNYENENIHNVCEISKEINSTINDNIKKNIVNKVTNNLNENIKENISNNISILNNIKPEEKNNNKINVNINNTFIKKSNNDNYDDIKNISTYTKNIINTNINKNEEINLTINNNNINQSYKQEKDINNPINNLDNNSISLFPNLSNNQIQNPKKRKRSDIENTFEIYNACTTKKIKYEHFPIIKNDNSKKLMNNSLLFFK